MKKTFDPEVDSEVASARQERYQIAREIGRGSSSIVYEACDTRTGRTVAMKLLTFAPALSAAQRDDLAARFAREAEAISALSHPGIVSVYEVGRAADGRQCLVMERLAGETLRARLLREGSIPARLAAEIGRQAAEALRYAHERGIVHRDVKPDNIFLTTDDCVKVMDFGVAWLRADGGHTQAGTVIGSPAYMAPEQINGQTPDARGDVFSLGATLFEMVAGRKPFDAPTIPAVMNQILRDKPPLELVQSRALRSVLSRALAKRPDARYPSMAALAEALRRSHSAAAPQAAAPIAPDATVIMSRPQPPTSRAGHRARAASPVLAGAAALALLAGAFLSLRPHATAHSISALALASQGTSASASLPPPMLPTAIPARVIVHSRALRRVARTKRRNLSAAVATAPTHGRAKAHASAAMKTASLPAVPMISERQTPLPPSAKLVRKRVIVAAKPVRKPIPLKVKPARDAPPPVPQMMLATRAHHEEKTLQIKIAAMQQERRLPPQPLNAASSSADAPDGESISYAANAFPRESESGDAPPRALTRVAPDYPASALAFAQSGTVRLRVLVDENGNVADVAVIRSSGSAALDEAARQCVRRWVYEPARQDGRAVPGDITERIVFRRD